ncbi:plasmid replication protein RepC [Ponticoccus alexandrii]|uniref:Replication initiation protein n=1 Tax=Ponticoccus alexandrii TaxID=1943633 RepID=A0ABX7FFD0_9RHOB|nr:plasmid replication protein RepC [Ponticoccus alexandrii]ETA52246.1 hypothetical protein P279_09660 [Rhodobacteraceae bacterium PD-2]QRF68927.1 replication initiation protein [Ponticoccus alexandrii]
MSYAPIAPFRRVLDRAALARNARASGGPEAVDKWEALRLLGQAREAFGLSHQALCVLQALVSFHPDTMLRQGAPAVVHPANATICERLAGMPCSTMRRHVARLVDAGVILRRDSPNGKRYARRIAGAKVAYGFDLSPLRARIEEFRAAAEEASVAAQRLRQARDCAKLMLRDLQGLLTLSDACTDPRRDALDDLARLSARRLRCKLGLADLETLHADLAQALVLAEALIPVENPSEPAEVSTRDAEIEQHQQRINKESFESIEDVEKSRESGSGSSARPTTRSRMPASIPSKSDEAVSLSDILTRCPDVQAFAPERVHDWPSLLRACDAIRPMLGLETRLWLRARQTLGAGGAAVALAVILQRFSVLRNPGGYLAHLVSQGAAGQFQPRFLLRTVPPPRDAGRCSQL